MRHGRCANEKYGHIGCKVDVLLFVDQQCSGKQSCSFPVAQLIVEGFAPCPSDVTAYLQASYTCVKGMPPAGVQYFFLSNVTVDSEMNKFTHTLQSLAGE